MSRMIVPHARPAFSGIWPVAIGLALALTACDRGSQPAPPAGTPDSTAPTRANVRVPAESPATSQPATAAADQPATHDPEGHGHTHAAPHGGVLMCVGDHFAHLEWVADPVAGSLTLYVLDGEAVGGVRVAEPQLDVRIQPIAAGAAAFGVKLDAVASSLTGETIGDTSQFVGRSDQLLGLAEYEGTLARISIKGTAAADQRFEIRLPRPNRSDP